ncbi:MAG: 4Fe-4S dicluster domain-containing protein, partial [Chloroflexi bacterium]|nr:4Fe-4S dicluster domain-containing protein [Chloroflexota bacterium]
PGHSYHPRWFPVATPCLAMATPSWLLQVLAKGAASVVLLTACARCSLGQGPVVGGRASFYRQVLRRLGQPADRVRMLDASDLEKLSRVLGEAPGSKRGPESQHDGPFCLEAVEGAFQAMRSLAGRQELPTAESLCHPYSPYGLVNIDAGACTGCLACAEACPTGALALEKGATTSVTLTYAPPVCTGCGLCAAACPESAARALSVRRSTDFGALSRGRVSLTTHKQATCVVCGAEISSVALLRHIEASLGEGNGPLNTLLGRYCASCRVLGASSGAPAPVH